MYCVMCRLWWQHGGETAGILASSHLISPRHSEWERTGTNWISNTYRATHTHTYTHTMHSNIPLTRAQQFLSVENLNVISAVSLTPTVVSVQWKHGNNILWPNVQIGIRGSVTQLRGLQLELSRGLREISDAPARIRPSHLLTMFNRPVSIVSW